MADRIVMDVDTRELTRFLRKFSDPQLTLDGIVEGMNRGRFEIRNRIIENLSGRILKRQTGRLVLSVFTDEAVLVGNNVEVKYGSRGVPYAATHEFGLLIPAHVVVPRTKKALAFFWPKVGKNVVFRRVTIPAIKMPERRPFRKGAEAALPQVRALIAVSVLKAYRDAGRV